MSRKKGVIFSYILMAVESVSSVLFTPYLIKCLGDAEYGIYGLVASITAYLYLLDLGVGNALVRYIAKFRFNKDKKSEKNLMAITLVFYASIAVLVITIGYLLTYFVPNIFGTGLSADEQLTAQSMLRITVLNASVTLLFSPMTKTLIAYEKFVLSKSIDIIKILVRVLLCCLFLYFGAKGVAVVSINLATTIGGGLACTFYVLFKLRILPKFTKIETNFIKDVLGYSFFILLQMIATQINSMVDHILIGAIVASASVLLAIYTAGTQITQYYQSFGSAINGVLMPSVVKMVESNSSSDVIQNEMIKVSRLIFMFLGFIYTGFLVCGKTFMIKWAGEGYEEGYYVALIIMLPMLFSLSQSIGSQVLWAMNKHQVQAYLKIGIAVANIFLTIILIKWNPMLGAAIGTGIALLFGDVIVMNIVYSKYIHISMIQYYFGMIKGIIPCLIVSGLSGWAISFLQLKGWIYIIVVIIVMCIVYAFTMLLYGLNPNEKNMFRRILIKSK